MTEQQQLSAPSKDTDDECRIVTPEQPLHNDTKPSTTKPNQQDQQKKKPFILPDHVEVTLRIAASLILALVLSFGNFPSLVPPSQSALVASITAAIAMVLPTLLFSVGLAIFPGMVMVTCVALLIATGLLAVAAVGGIHCYIAAYFVTACVLSGLRFHPQLAGNVALVLMLTALNTMGPSAAAAEQGLPFVASLWTEQGTDNPNAVMRNSLIGMCWIALCCAFGRLIPPFRTARNLLSTKLLPKVLHDVARFIRLTVANHTIIEEEKKNGNNNRCGDNDNSSQVRNDKDDEEEEITISDVTNLVHDATITTGGGVAGLTALEPRITRCGAPMDDVVGNLKELTCAVDGALISALALRAFSRAGFEELQVKGGGLRAQYLDTADQLDRCAKALSSTESSHMEASVEKDENDDDDIETGRKTTWTTPFDPVFLKGHSDQVEAWTRTWIASMRGTAATGAVSDTNPSTTKSTKEIIVASIMPWLMGGGFGLVLAIVGNVKKVFTPSTWKNIVRPPYTDLAKAWWCLKFAVGFTALVSMSVYWPEFRNLEIPVDDEGNPVQGAHFAGWYLIAYAFGTTQTMEGTFKKSTLRMLGTILGGFSAWLAVTACGSEDPYGLVIWLTVTSTAVAYWGLPRGFKSRMGLDKDFAWGPGYFSMTQALVAVDIYWGVGGKNDITINRIVSNCVGISMAMLMAAIPPTIYGGSPRLAQDLLEEKKKVFRSCIESILEASSTADSEVPTKDLKSRLETLHDSAKTTFMAKYKEVNDNYTDANQLQRMCVLQVDPKLEEELDRLAVLGSSILALLRTAIRLVDMDEPLGLQFCEDSFDRKELETVLENIDNMTAKERIAAGVHHQATDGEIKKEERSNLSSGSQGTIPAGRTFVHYCIYIQRVLAKSEVKLAAIKWGLLPQATKSE